MHDVALMLFVLRVLVLQVFKSKLLNILCSVTFFSKLCCL
jgi:hypothetical protein